MIRFFTVSITAAILSLPVFSSTQSLSQWPAHGMSAKDRAWLEKALEDSNQIVDAAREHMNNPNSTRSVPGVPAAQMEWVKKMASDANTVKRYTHQQMTTPGATPEPAFFELPKNLQEGAKQAVAYMRQQQSSSGQRLGY